MLGELAADAPSARSAGSFFNSMRRVSPGPLRTGTRRRPMSSWRRYSWGSSLMEACRLESPSPELDGVLPDMDTAAVLSRVGPHDQRTELLPVDLVVDARLPIAPAARPTGGSHRLLRQGLAVVVGEHHLRDGLEDVAQSPNLDRAFDLLPPGRSIDEDGGQQIQVVLPCLRTVEFDPFRREHRDRL